MPRAPYAVEQRAKAGHRPKLGRLRMAKIVNLGVFRLAREDLQVI